MAGASPWVHWKKHLCSESSLPGENPALEIPCQAGCVWYQQGGRAVRPDVLSAAAHPVLLPPPPQGISSAPSLLLLDESPVKVLVVSWESLVEVWQSKSLCWCVGTEAFLVLLLLEKLLRGWFCPAGFSLTVQRC